MSIATVSRVINGSDRVSPRTRQKVLRVIEENGYTPNAFARGLGLNTMHTIGLLCADAADPYLAQAVNDLERRLRQSGYDSLLCCTGYEQETKEKYLSLLLSKRVDGLVLVGSHFVESEEAGNAYIRRAAQEVPVMLLGGALAGQNLYAVRCDERAAMRGAVRRLLASGRQNVLYLYNSMSFSGRNKLAGYREGYADAGRSAPEGLALLATSALLFAGIAANKRVKEVHRHKDASGRMVSSNGRKKIHTVDAILIGITQCLAAIFPGLSRSGSTLSVGLLRGINQQTALDYSFVLGIPSIAAAALVSILDMGDQADAVGAGALVAGIITAAVVGFLAIKLLKWIVTTNKLHIFAFYTLIAGGLITVIGMIEHITGNNLFTGLPL